MIQATIGERVTIQPDHCQRPSQKDLTFEIVEVIKTGNTRMIGLMDDSGQRHKYFRVDELMAAPNCSDSAGEQLWARATRIASESHGRLTLSDALKRASRERLDLAEAHMSARVAERPSPHQQLRSVSDAPEDGLLTLANQIAREQHLSLRDAIKLASQNVTAVQQYRTRFNCGVRT